MGRTPKIGPKQETMMIGLHLDKELQDRMAQKCLEKGISKREYVTKLIIDDLGLRYIPAHYEEII